MNIFNLKYIFFFIAKTNINYTKKYEYESILYRNAII